jgi:hypothetical protein
VRDIIGILRYKDDDSRTKVTTLLQGYEKRPGNKVYDIISNVELYVGAQGLCVG